VPACSAARARELGGVDRDLALEFGADRLGEVDVEALDAAGQFWHRVRREGAVDGGAQILSGRS
jgi:hypothetical protein